MIDSSSNISILLACYNGFGVAYYCYCVYRKAIEFHRKSLSLNLKLYPDGMHPDIIWNYRNLSLACRKAGETALANEYAKKAEAIENKLTGQ